VFVLAVAAALILVVAAILAGAAAWLTRRRPLVSMALWVAAFTALTCAADLPWFVGWLVVPVAILVAARLERRQRRIDTN
jgi:hypothetical protein